jgi:hypothetical protein
MPIIVIIVLLVLLLGGGGTYHGQRSGWGAPHYGGGLLGLILLVLLVLWLTGNVGKSSIWGRCRSRTTRPSPCRFLRSRAEYA